MVPLAAQVSDDLGVVLVQFFVDGGLVGDDDRAPFAATWDTAGFADGAHSIRAIASDTAGQTALAAGTRRTDRIRELAEPVACLKRHPVIRVDRSAVKGYRFDPGYRRPSPPNPSRVHGFQAANSSKCYLQGSVLRSAD